MALSPEQLDAELRQLPAATRARLAHALLESLDEPATEYDCAWATEADRRAGELAAGTAEAVPAAEALARLRARLGDAR